MDMAELERAFNRAALDALNLAAAAPAFTGACAGCGSHVDGFQLVEFGYSRWTSLVSERDEAGELMRLTAYADGWDDMSEHGLEPEFVVCRSCSTVHGYPDVDIDWA